MVTELSAVIKEGKLNTKVIGITTDDAGNA